MLEEVLEEKGFKAKTILDLTDEMTMALIQLFESQANLWSMLNLLISNSMHKHQFRSLADFKWTVFLPCTQYQGKSHFARFSIISLAFSIGKLSLNLYADLQLYSPIQASITFGTVFLPFSRVSSKISEIYWLLKSFPKIFLYDVAKTSLMLFLWSYIPQMTHFAE